LDAEILGALHAHQRGDKGFGPALGPTATRVAERLFREAGYRTWTAWTPWRLTEADRPLALALMEGWEGAAREQHPEGTGRIGAWAARRRTVLAGAFSLAVGHLDLLALPEGEP